MKKLFLCFAILFLLTGCGKEKEEFETNLVNLNEGVIEDKVIGDISLHNTSVIYEKGVSTYKTELSVSKETYIKQMTVTFKSKNGMILTTLTSYIDKTIKDKINITISSDVNLTNAYQTEYTFE